MFNVQFLEKNYAELKGQDNKDSVLWEYLSASQMILDIFPFQVNIKIRIWLTVPGAIQISVKT